MDYASTGVDREKEEKGVKAIMKAVQAGMGKEGLLSGHFAGSIPFGDYLLSLATDGVGTKVITAQQMEEYDTIGIDCVAMNVNDLITVGSIPQAFVDYIAIKDPNDQILEQIASGLANGCAEANIQLIGGETAVMPEILTTIHKGNGFDLAGTALGIHKAENTITGEEISVNDAIIGISSSGIHSNGLTLARKLFDENKWKNELLTPTRIYVDVIKGLLDSSISIHGMAHITGGGLNNLNRLKEMKYHFQKWPQVPEIFLEIQKRGNVDTEEMYKTYNMGIGFMLIVPKSEKSEVIDRIEEFYPCHDLGIVEKGSGVQIRDIKF